MERFVDPAAGPEPSLTPRLVAVAAGVVILFGLHAIASLVVLVLLSVLATLLLAPLQADLRRRGLPGWLAIVVAVVVYVGVLGVAGVILAVGLAGFVRDLPAYRDELDTLLAEVGATFGGSAAAAPVEADAVEGLVRSLIDDLVGMLATVGYSVFIVAYLLLEAPRAGLRVRDAFGSSSDVPTRAAALAIRLRTYVVARAILGAVAAVLDTLFLVILGVPDALLWGVLSFLLSFIPNIGFILALIPPTVMGLLVGGLPLAIAVVIGYVVINVAIDYVVQPKFVGSSVDLAAVVVTVCLLFWGIVLGPAGALLAVPMTIIAAATFDTFAATRPLARLLGQGPPDAGEMEGGAA